MDVARVRVCKGSYYVEIRLDWKYEGEDYHALASIPLTHFRKRDIWSIVRMLLDSVESQSKEKEEQ